MYFCKISTNSCFLAPRKLAEKHKLLLSCTVHTYVFASTCISTQTHTLTHTHKYTHTHTHTHTHVSVCEHVVREAGEIRPSSWECCNSYTHSQDLDKLFSYDKRLQLHKYVRMYILMWIERVNSLRHSVEGATFTRRLRTHECTYVRTYVRTYIRTYMCTCTYVYVCTYTYIHTYVRMYVRTCDMCTLVRIVSP